MFPFIIDGDNNVTHKGTIESGSLIFNSLNDIMKTVSIADRLRDVRDKVVDTLKDIAEKA